jgi:tRNA U34 2-thiouridine synthase MnmA/TrmU
LCSTSSTLTNFNWINKTIPTNKNVLIRFRHRQPLIKGKFTIKGKEVILTYPKFLAAAPGQFGVLYQKNICLGGGIIQDTNI